MFDVNIMPPMTRVLLRTQEYILMEEVKVEAVESEHGVFKHTVLFSDKSVLF